MNQKELRIERIVHAPPDRVFSAWTTANELAAWWGPEGITCKSAEIDARVGGTYRIENALPDGSTLWIFGEFEVVDKPVKLVFSWRVSTSTAAPERVTIDFQPHRAGTQIVLTHEKIPTAERREQHESGWCGCLDGLSEFAKRVGDSAQ